METSTLQKRVTLTLSRLRRLPASKARRFPTTSNSWDLLSSVSVKVCLREGTMTCLKMWKTNTKQKKKKSQHHTDSDTFIPCPPFWDTTSAKENRSVSWAHRNKAKPSQLWKALGWKDEIRIYRKQSTKVYSVCVEGWGFLFVWFFFFISTPTTLCSFPFFCFLLYSTSRHLHNLNLSLISVTMPYTQELLNACLRWNERLFLFFSSFFYSQTFYMFLFLWSLVSRLRTCVSVNLRVQNVLMNHWCF